MDYSALIESCLGTCRKMVLSHLSSRSESAFLGFNQFGNKIHSVDIVAEKAVLSCLSQRLCSGTLISEESGVVAIGDGGKPFIVLDPIDGSTNAVKGYPCFSTSIAVADGNYLSNVVAGGVVNLVTGDIFTGLKNKGAQLNSSNIHVSEVSKLEDAFISADLNTRGRLPGYIKMVSGALERAQHVRFLGTDALEMCLVGSGSADAFIDLRGLLRVTDIAASTLIIREAGGLVLKSDGSELEMDLNPPSRTSFVASSTRELFRDIMNRML